MLPVPTIAILIGSAPATLIILSPQHFEGLIKMISYQRLVPVLQQGEHAGRVGGPDVGVEDLHLDVAGVAGRADRPAHRPEIDDPVAHHRPAEQHVGGQRHEEVADLEARDPVRAPGRRDPRFDLRVPPQVECVDHDADRGGRAYGSSWAIASRMWSLAALSFLLLSGRPPTTRTRQAAPSAAASSIAARLSSSQPGRLKNPPRHSEDTRSPASRVSLAARARPNSATGSRHRPTAPMPCRAQPSASS